MFGIDNHIVSQILAESFCGDLCELVTKAYYILYYTKIILAKTGKDIQFMGHVCYICNICNNAFIQNDVRWIILNIDFLYVLSLGLNP